MWQQKQKVDSFDYHSLCLKMMFGTMILENKMICLDNWTVWEAVNSWEKTTPLQMNETEVMQCKATLSRRTKERRDPFRLKAKGGRKTNASFQLTSHHTALHCHSSTHRISSLCPHVVLYTTLSCLLEDDYTPKSKISPR